MKNKLKEMLLKHKPISEETLDIDDIWGETVADGAENFEEIPEDGTPQEDKIVVDVPEEEDTEEVVEDVPAEEEEDAEEVDEDEPAEETNHTIADAIEESFLIPKAIKIKYHNNRIKANTKKVNKNLDKLDKSTDAEGNPVGNVDIEKLKAKVDKKATKLDAHADKYKEVHDKKHEKLAEKILYKPGKLEKMVRDPRRLKRIPDPSMFAAQVENMANYDNETKDRLVKTTSKQRDDVAKHIKQLQQAGQKPEYNEKPKVMPTTKVAQTPHQKVASNAAAVKERLSKVKASM